MAIVYRNRKVEALLKKVVDTKCDSGYPVPLNGRVDSYNPVMSYDTSIAELPTDLPPRRDPKHQGRPVGLPTKLQEATKYEFQKRKPGNSFGYYLDLNPLECLDDVIIQAKYKYICSSMDIQVINAIKSGRIPYSYILSYKLHPGTLANPQPLFTAYRVDGTYKDERTPERLQLLAEKYS